MVAGQQGLIGMDSGTYMYPVAALTLKLESCYAGAYLSKSSPPVTNSVTRYTLRGVMYTAYKLMQLGCWTCTHGVQ